MEKELDIKKIIDLFPVFSTWAIIYTCLGLYSYYHSFNVDIFGYIDISELVLLSLSKFVITILALVVFFFISTLHPFQNFFNESDPLGAGDISNFKLSSYPFYFALVFAIVLSIIDYNNELINVFEKIKGFCIAWVVINLPIYLSLCYIYIRKEKKQILTVMLIFPFIYSCAISVLLGYIERDTIRKEPTGNSIVFKNKLIKSTKHYYYIGQTKNYVFYHNDTLNVTDIFPAKFVSKMTLK